MTPLTIVRFNPYWNAPPSIVEKDIVPRMLSTRPSKVMGDMNMKIFKGVGGPEVDPNSINWRRVLVDDYHFRQEPGGSNAMATAKIEFNSPFGIYLHDTPEPQLFASGERLFSSGCVRVQNVAIFINWVLQGQDGIDSNRITTSQVVNDIHRLHIRQCEHCQYRRCAARIGRHFADDRVHGPRKQHHRLDLVLWLAGGGFELACLR